MGKVGMIACVYFSELILLLFFASFHTFRVMQLFREWAAVSSQKPLVRSLKGSSAEWICLI